MFRNRIWLRIHNRKDHSTKKSSSRPTNDLKNFKVQPTVTDCSDGEFSSKRKIGQLGIDSNHDILRKRRKSSEIDESRDINVDRISELPEPIIHLIFTFLKCSKDVARTSILSKKWKNTFNSYLSFDFDQRWCRAPKAVGKHNKKARKLQKEKFKCYVNRSIATRLEPVPSIDKFRLYVNNMDIRLRECMEKWICDAVDKNVKELDIQLNGKHFTIGKNFILPSTVLLSTSIASLKLSGYILFGFTPICMSNLRELSIKDTLMINKAVITKFDKCCPLMEVLRLVHCRGIFDISIPSLKKLRRVEVHECDKVSHIEIASPNVESFSFHAEKYQECKINLESLGSLKTLTLKDYRMVETGLQGFLSKAPVLEKLVLLKCTKLRRLTILSDRLRSLALFQCYKLQEVNINAPNLSSLQYSGHRVTFSSINIPGLREAKFSFGPAMRTNQHLVEYQRHFLDFDRSKGFKLIVYSKQSMTIYEDPREALEAQNFFCNLELTASLRRVMKVVDDWLRESRGRCIVLVSASSELIQLTQKMIMDTEDNPTCCRFYSNKCWRHYIEDVTTRNLACSDRIYYDFKWKIRRHSSESSNSNCENHAQGENEKDDQMTKNEKAIFIGPWGRPSGNCFVDGYWFVILEMVICVLGPQMKLQFPDEFLMTVTGHYCSVVRGGSPVIQSITFGPRDADENRAKPTKISS
ncbi:F-box family protein [Striga asiatica]|uniref:F-box family protein n=1 Tax=Striga asiatica TaxID=4170 RepID=A0A5A7QIW2_STRAF|nr:F-box family protein [Striga asiatica]